MFSLATTRWRRRVGVGLLALATATPVAQMITGTAHADLNAITDDTSVTAKTGSWFLSNVSEAAVNNALSLHNARPTNIKVDSVAPMRFTVTWFRSGSWIQSFVPSPTSTCWCGLS